MAHYILNCVGDEREHAAALLRVELWGVDARDRHADALAAGDLVLVYLGAPARLFVARAELASAVHPWTPAEAGAYPGHASAGVSLARIEEWDPPIPMADVLSRLAANPYARADFDEGVVQVTEQEYETVLAVAASR